MLHDRFSRSVQKYPDEPALIAAGRQCSYAEVDAVSRRIKHRILAEGLVRPRAGLLATRTVETYAAYLAVLRIGGVVVPLDASHPAERLAQVARSAGLDCVVTDEGQETRFVDGLPTSVLRLGPDTASDAVFRDDVPDWTAAPDDVAYVLFTSGSTGRPKGVPIRQSNVDEFLEFNIARYAMGPGCRHSQLFHPTFDPSVFDMFVTWGAGATLVVPSADELYDPVAFVNEHQLTHWYSVPSVISMASTAHLLSARCMPSLRSSLFCGERFTLDQAHTWADAAPNSTLENLYGPTELTVTVTSYRLPRERADWPTTSNGSVPIGQVYPHLDSRIDPENGELQVRGSQRFFGYHDAEDNEGKFVDLTAAPSDSNSTVPGPTAWFRTGDHVVVEDGVLVHLGRLDHQVKIRGYRVELHEIETALRVWGGVDDAVVHAIAKANGQVELAAVCTGNVPAAGALRALLRPRLPAYMIPTRIVPLTRLPLNDRGKVDRTACAATLRGEYS